MYTVVNSKYKAVQGRQEPAQLNRAYQSLVQPRRPYSSLFKTNPALISLVQPYNCPHTLGYFPTGLDLGVLGCAGLLGSGRLYWAPLGHVGLCYAVRGSTAL